MLRPAGAVRGFSLIELMVTLAVATLLMVAVIPAVTTWMADARVRAAGEALQNAARLAQGEALKRSRTSVLALTTAAPALNATPAANAQHWFVQVVTRPSDSASEAASLYVRGGTEPSSLNVTVAGPALLCFNAFGQQTALGATATGLGVKCDTASPAVYTLSGTGASRSMKVQVALGGQVRLCDASKTFSDSTPDGC